MLPLRQRKVINLLKKNTEVMMLKMLNASAKSITAKEYKAMCCILRNAWKDLCITQIEGSIIEDSGVIKMDFLGLKTLSIIRDALKIIKEKHSIEIDIDAIPLDDQKTYELYQR